MTAWAAIRRFGLVAVFGGVFALSGVAADAPAPKPAPPVPVRTAKPTPDQLRDAAEKAEKAGDWEAAFNAYCHLFVTDRASPELREKLNAALRRVQQTRRHRDPGFQQFATGMTLPNGLDLFAEVVREVPRVYAERDKASPQNLWSFAVEEIDRALGNAGFRQAFLDNPRADKVDQFRAELRRDWAKRTVADEKAARAAMRQLVAKAQDTISVRVPAALAVEGACGACSGLDEYTVFLNPNGAQSAAVPDLTAAGLYLAWAKDALVVDAVAPGSWVALNHPHLRRGDRILRVNGRAMENAGLAGAAEALRHPGIDGYHQIELPPVAEDQPLTMKVPVNVPTVYGRRLIGSEGVGYLRIGSFSTTTPRELDEEINALKIDGARVLVIDLRGNHGGSFLAGVEVARRLLPSGIIVTTQGQAAEVDNVPYSSTSGMTAHDIPIVLLIDAETASAAEVLAAALKDHKRAELVGMPSFGKGTVQYPLRLVSLDDIDPVTGKKASKTGTVRVTIAKLISPRGEAINGLGVTPHILEADYEIQLNKAINTALEKLSDSMMMPPAPMLVSPLPD